jgi:hypothetical protein
MKQNWRQWQLFISLAAGVINELHDFERLYDQVTARTYG